MCAAITRIGEDHPHRSRPFLFFRLAIIGQHQADIIGIAKRDIALAGKDRFRLAAVCSVRLAGEIVLQTRQPRAGIIDAVMGDHRGDQRDIVGMLAVANADLALPLGIGKFLIGNVLLCHPLLRSIDNPTARRQTKPFALGITQIGGDILFDDGIAQNRLGNLAFLRLDEAGDINRQQHICG
ncbi:hypothetical protein D3C86_1308590 [compost metagenome]